MLLPCVLLLLASCSVPDHDRADHEPVGHDIAIVPTGTTVLFQGDSITDAGRERKPQHADTANGARGLGRGYASLAAGGLMVQMAPHDVRCFNRGVSGNKVFQLAERWQRDCLDLQPDVLSILIGVNDIWHTRDGKYDGTAAVYERDYDALLQRTRDALPDVTLIVCEPFVLPCGAVDASWFPEFDEYRAAARRVADKHGATFVPFHSMFEAAMQHHPAEHWAKDGVHPTRAGAALMAKAWLRTLHGDREHE
ncbi:MAG: SGNH/GDSL hydrolase family protein [Planctomycetota bacterium]